MNSKKNNNSDSGACVKENSMAQTVRFRDDNSANASSMHEISIIETMESFLEENGAKEVDQKILRRMAEALTKRLNDTSPGTLQDVTMNNSYAVAGYRSLSGSLQPNYHGTASPSTQGRSVREFEEQLSALRKENFNLKLKLYFMEETLPGYQQALGSEGHDALAKQIIDSKVEIEMLRKECKEKQDLLRDAAQAINHLEDIQKQTDEKYQNIVEELKQKINFMEMEREVERSQSSIDVANDTNEEAADLVENINSLQKISELESIIREHEEKIEEFYEQISKLDEILIERDATIKECEAKIKTLEFQNAELMESLETKNNDFNNVEADLADCRSKYNKLKLEYKEMLHDYKVIKEEYNKRMNAMKKSEKELDLQQQNIIKMESALNAQKTLAESKIALLNDYDNMMKTINARNNTRENRFFRTIVNKFDAKKIPNALTADHHYNDSNLQNVCAMSNGCIFKAEAGGAPVYDCNNNTLTGDSDSSLPISEIEYNYNNMFASKSADNIRRKTSISELIEDGNGAAGDFCGQCGLKFSNKDKNPTQMSAALAAYDNLLSRTFLTNANVSSHHKFVKIHQEKLKTNFNTKRLLATAAVAVNNAYKKQLTMEATIETSATMKMANEIQLKNQQLRKEIQDLKIQMADKVCVLDETEEKLKHRTEVYEKALRTIQKLMLTIGSQKKEIAELKSKRNETNCSHVTLPNKTCDNIAASGISGLECSGIIRSLSDSEVLNQNEVLIVDLRKQLEQALTDADNADKWRRECADVCTVLTNRLEELAGFLNSLLKQKDVLGILAADRRRAIRKAVDRSLDLSKSLNMTLSFSGMSMADHSLARISNLSEIFNYDDEERTFNSHEDLTRPSIDFRKSEKQFAWKKDALSNTDKHRRSGETKKERRSLPLHLSQENQSESEAWSEPDRKVSMARIGLDENSASLSKDLPVKTLAPSSESECDVHNISRNAKQRTQERIVQLEQMIAQRDERILEIQSQLVDTDSCLKQENLRVLELRKEIQHLEKQISSNSNMINSSLLAQIDEKSEALEQCHTELEELKLKHEIAIALAKEQLKEKLNDLQVEMENKQQESLEKLREQHKALIAQEYIDLVQYNEIKTQLLELQRQYIEAQRTIDNLTDNEHELKQIMLDNEMEARSLKKQLDESTLQASKAIMERTKAFNDKLQLEKHVEQMKTQLATLETERSLSQQNIIKLEEQLATAIMNKTIKNIINNKGASDASASGYTSEEVPHAFSDNSTNSFNNLKSTKAMMVTEQRAIAQRQINTSSPDLGIESDAGRISSGELSSTQQQQRCNNNNTERTIELNISLQQAKEERTKDLSCDDAVDINIKPEITRNEITTASIINVPTPTTTSAVQHDCVKVDQENAELRRKLLRTKKAFEDTYEKLRIANQKKAQVEKDIKNQILKTHNVLRNVRSNMENEL